MRDIHDAIKEGKEKIGDTVKLANGDEVLIKPVKGEIDALGIYID